MMLITICALPFRGAYAALDWLEPDLVDGRRPLWWRLTGTALGFLVLVAAPFLVRWGARQVVRTEGWLCTPAHDDGTPAA